MVAGWAPGRGRDKRLRPSSLACHSVPRGSPLFNTNVHSTTVMEQRREPLASVHGASLGTEGTAAHWEKSQGALRRLRADKRGAWDCAASARETGVGVGGRKGQDGSSARGRRRPSRGRAGSGRGGAARLGAAGGQEDPRIGSLGGQWNSDGGLWTGGRWRLSLLDFCAERRPCSSRARRGRKRTSRAELEPGAPSGRNKVTPGQPRGAHAQSGGRPARARQPSAHLPGFGSPTAEWEERACARAPLGFSAQP